MTGTEVVTNIVQIMVSAITGIAEGVGTGFSTLIDNIFFTTTGDVQSLSVFGIMIIVFAAISLGIGLCRWVVNFLTSLGARNR